MAAASTATATTADAVSSESPPTALRERNGVVRIAVHVKPRASKDRVLGERQGLLEVAVSAPPAEGAANRAVIELLAETLDIPRRDLVIASGHSSRSKIIDVTGVTLTVVRQRLGI